MATTAQQQSCTFHEEMESLTMSDNDVLEEIDEDQSSLIFGKPQSLPATPEARLKSPQVEETLPQSPESPSKAGRDFGNISPISELLDDDDLDVERETRAETEDADDSGKVTPEPGVHPNNRGSFPRIPDGRSSPILAYSPSLLKSPSSNGSGKSRIQQSSPPSGGSGGGVGKRPRNIARMLDNISDHSSGEEDVNTVGAMMAKFTV